MTHQWRRKLSEQAPTPWTMNYKSLGNVNRMLAGTVTVPVICLVIIVCGSLALGLEETNHTYVLINGCTIGLVCMYFLLCSFIALKVRQCRDNFSIRS